jgi:hypothetical protein
MRSGIGRAATMPKARAEVATKMVENCILNLVVVVVGRVEKIEDCVVQRVDVVVKNVSWKLKGPLLSVVVVLS